MLEPVEDEGLEELEGHLLGQAALVQLEVGPTTITGSRVVHALAEQVLARERPAPQFFFFCRLLRSVRVAAF